MTSKIDYTKARSPLATEDADTHIQQTAKNAKRHRTAKAVAKGTAKRKRDAANEAARIQALGRGEVFAPTTVRRDPRTTPTPTPDQPPDQATQASEKVDRAQACSDAKLGGLRSKAQQTPEDEHPQFPGRRPGWQPNRRQRRILREQGLL